MMNATEIKVSGYQYDILVMPDETFRFRTKRFGLLTEAELLMIISEVTDEKTKNQELRKTYSKALEHFRPVIIAYSKGERGSVGANELYYVIEQYCSHDTCADLYEHFKKLKLHDFFLGRRN